MTIQTAFRKADKTAATASQLKEGAVVLSITESVTSILRLTRFEEMPEHYLAPAKHEIYVSFEPKVANSDAGIYRVIRIYNGEVELLSKIDTENRNDCKVLGEIESEILIALC